MSKAATIFSDAPAPPSAEKAKSISGCATRIMKRFCLAISVRSLGAMAGLGIRAKAENSSTMRLISSTWRTIVAVHWSNTSRSVRMTLPYLRRIRSADSWIGVSGFLISWAMRRATSPQAEVRWAWTRSVMSSSVTTAPRAPPGACSPVTRTVTVRSSLRSPRVRVSWICCCTARWRASPSASTGASSGTAAPRGWPTSRSLPRSSIRSAAGLAMVTKPAASRPITPGETPESTASVKRRRASIRSLAAISPACWRRSSWVILLKLSPRLARSPLVFLVGTWA